MADGVNWAARILGNCLLVVVGLLNLTVGLRQSSSFLVVASAVLLVGALALLSWTLRGWWIDRRSYS
jgi:hypothetical protein